MKKFKRVLAVLISALLVCSCVLQAVQTAGKKEPADEKTANVAILQFMPHSSLDNCTEGVIKALDAAGIGHHLEIGSSGSAVADCQSYAEKNGCFGL